MADVRKGKGKSNGQAMLETALVLPFILLVVFGVFELGRIVFIFSAVNNASREASRFGAATGNVGSGPRYLDCDAVRQAAIDTAFLAGLTDADITVEYDTPVGGSMQVYGRCVGSIAQDINTGTALSAGDVAHGDRIRVKVDRQIDPILSLFPSFNPEFVTARTILKDIPIGPPECNDGVDNDGDGLIDYRDDGTGDPGCSSFDDTTEAFCYTLFVPVEPIDVGTVGEVPGTNCANRYIEGTIVNLTAFPDIRNDPTLRPDYTFDYWDGPIDDADNTTNPTTVSMNADKEITAHFRPVETDLIVTKTGSPEPVGSEKLLRYTIQVSNAGPDIAHEIRVTDTLPSEVTYVGTVENGWACDDSALPEIVCTLPELTDGAFSSFQIDVTTPVANGAPTLIENEATVSATETDADPNSNTVFYQSNVQPRAELSIEKVGPTGIIWADTVFDYTIRVTNHGPSDATGVLVIDELPDQVEYITSAYPAAGDCDYNGTLHTVECDISSLPAGNVATITISVRAPEEEPADAVENIATVTANETEDDTSDNTTAPVDSEIESHADLSIEKLAPRSVARDEAFEYSLTVTNNGPSPAPNVTVVDTLPTGVNFISELDGICSEASGIVTCNLGTMAKDDIQQVMLTVEATQDTENERALQNSATVSSDIDDRTTGNDTDTADTAVFIDVQLTIDKSATASSVNEGDVFSYVIDVGNAGASTATGVVLTDRLPDGVAFDAMIDNGGWTCNTGSPPTITCSPSDGLLRGGESTTIIIQVSATDVGDIDNTATLDAEEVEAVSSSAGVNSDPAFDLTVEMSGPASGTVGTPFDFTVSIVNSGPSDATQAQVTIFLDSSVTFNNASGNSWSCDPVSATQVLCDLTGTIAGGASSDINVTVTPEAAVDVTNESTVAATGDTTTTNNSAFLTTPVEPTPVE